MIIYSIYKIVNTINGKVYIGMTNNSKKRFKTHLYLSNCKSPQLLIQKKIAHYGKEHFTYTVLYETKDVDVCKEMETHFITEYNSIAPNGYNIHSGGNYCPIKTRDNCRDRMINNNPGNTPESLRKKSSTILAYNSITNESIIVANRKEFAKKHGLFYSSIGWAIQNKRPLKNEWYFSYIDKRTMGA